MSFLLALRVAMWAGILVAGLGLGLLLSAQNPIVGAAGVYLGFRLAAWFRRRSNVELLARLRKECDQTVIEDLVGHATANEWND